MRIFIIGFQRIWTPPEAIFFAMLDLFLGHFPFSNRILRSPNVQNFPPPEINLFRYVRFFSPTEISQISQNTGGRRLGIILIILTLKSVNFNLDSSLITQDLPELSFSTSVQEPFSNNNKSVSKLI